MPKTLDQHIDGLQKFLNGNDTDDEKTKQVARLAIVKQAAQDMSPEDKKEARKAFDEEDKDTDKKDSMDTPEKDTDKKDSMDEPEKEDKKDSKKSKKGKSGMDEEEKDEKIASLTATVTTLVAQPTIDKMLKARTDSGMPQEEVVKFGKSLYGKSIDEITQRYKEDQHLFKQSLVGSTPQESGLPFNGKDDLMLTGADTGDKTMEEMLSA